MPLNNIILRLLKLIVSFLALIALFSLINVKDLVTSLLTFNVFFLFLILILTLLNVFLFVWAYRFILKNQLPLMENFLEYLVAWSFGLFLPGKLGELGIIPLLKEKYKIPYKFCGTAVVLPKIFLFLILFFFAVIFGITMVPFNYTFWIGIGILIIFLALFFWHKIERFLFRFAIFADLINNKEKIREMLGLTNLAMLICVSLLRFFFIVVITFLSYYGFGINVPLPAVVFGVAVAQMVSFIPITINGLGIREASFSGIMAANGVPLSASIGAVSISLIVNYGVAILIIFIWNIFPFLHKKKM